MTTECCKFCGAEKWYVKDDGDGAFECRTTLDYSWRSSDCKVATGARYEALFPIPPWSTEPITAEMCVDKFGMKKVGPQLWQFGSRKDGSAVVYQASSNRAVCYGHDFGGADGPTYAIHMNVTAGQLALLIAARKGAVK